MVPEGKSLIFPTRAGSFTWSVMSSLLTSPEDLQRLAVGRFTPFGHRLHTRRYDAGDTYPDMEFGDTRSAQEPDTGVWRLPLGSRDFRAEGAVRVNRRRGAGPVPVPGPIPDGEKLARLLDRLPPGKYVVDACREFPRRNPAGFMSRGNVLQREQARAGRGRGARSDPGSLSGTAVTDSRSGDSSRGWADSLMQSAMQHGETYQSWQQVSTAPKHRQRPRRRAPTRDPDWHRRRKGPKRMNRVETPSDAESDAHRGRKTVVSRLRSLTAPLTAPRTTVRRFKKALREPLRDPLRRSSGWSGDSSEGST